jgi:long-chain acyl-CoA synthetase
MLHESYGSSEMALVTLIDSADALRKPGSAGRPLPGVTIRALDEAGRPCAPGQTGLLYVGVPAIPAFTYLDAPEARQAAERDGAVTLGDLGYLDEEGFVYLVDRRSDMVNSAGTKIHTPEIEAVLMQMPGIADCAVYCAPDEEFGQALVAAVQALPGGAPTAEQVRQFVRERLADFKVPRHVEFHEALPREDTGKLFKRRLRQAVAAAA